MIARELTVRAWRLEELMQEHQLDPVTVVTEDVGPGQGRLIVTCFGRAFSAYWGAMGEHNTVASFIRKADPGYLADKLMNEEAYTNMRKRDRDLEYLKRIVAAVQQHFKELI